MTNEATSANDGLGWRELSYTNADSTEGLQWFKSSYSGNDDQTDCVEGAHLPYGGMAVRDSKNPGPMLTFPGQAWGAFRRSLQRSDGD